MSMNGRRTNEASGEMWRLFIAVPLPDAVRDVMADVQAGLRRHGWPVKWVDPSLAHITLKFLGNVDSGRVPGIESKLDAVVMNVRLARSVTGAIGAFPSPSRARVIWLGLDGDLSPMAGLADGIDRAMSDLGFEHENRPFKPHITLGRLRKDARPPRDFEQVVSALDVRNIGVHFDRVQLIRSVLGRSGPAYTTLAEWELRTSAVELAEHG